MTPPGLAKFDSATAMLRALARFLHGKDFRGLGQPAPLRGAVHFADLVPRQLREGVFAKLGAQEGLRPDKASGIDTQGIASWAVEEYPQRRYPAVMLGSSNGALMHLAAAFGIPWLPQTFLTLIQLDGIHPDDPRGAMEASAQAAEQFLKANPEVQLHQLHDPNQDRLMLDHITYFRFKYRRLPTAYRTFLLEHLEPGGSIVISDCQQRWPVTRIGERQVFQFGAVGGATWDEYFEGGKRVAKYLQRYESPRERWHPPEPDSYSPEAEWGFEESILAELEQFADEHGFRIERLSFNEPEDPSPAVAEFYREWYRELEVRENRLVFESFILLEPYWALRTGTVPFWMTFNKEPSLQAAQRYLASCAPYDHVYLMLFAHGTESVGLPPIEHWQQLLRAGRDSGELLGVNPDEYPAHFSVFAKHSNRLRALSPHYPLPQPPPIERLNDFIARWNKS